METEHQDSNRYLRGPILTRRRVVITILIALVVESLLLFWNLQTLQILEAKSFAVWPYWILFLFTAITWGVTWILIGNQNYGTFHELFCLNPTEADREKWPCCTPVRSASMWAYPLLVCCSLIDLADVPPRSGSPQFVLSTLFALSSALIALFLPLMFIDTSASARVLAIGIGGVLFSIGIPTMIVMTWAFH